MEDLASLHTTLYEVNNNK